VVPTGRKGFMGRQGPDERQSARGRAVLAVSIDFVDAPDQLWEAAMESLVGWNQLVGRLARVALASLGLLAISNSANACAEDEYQGAFGWCYRKIGGVVGQTAEGAKHGDWDTFSKGIGDIAITTTCPACAVLGQAVLSRQDRAAVSTIAGRGLILYSIGLPPSLVFVDAGVKAIPLTAPQQPVSTPAPEAAPSRAKKTYKVATQAACVVVAGDGRLSAGWLSAPALIDASTGTASTFPAVDLMDGDIISVTAEPCAEADIKGNKALTFGTFSYEYSNMLPSQGPRMKYFLSGKRLS